MSFGIAFVSLGITILFGTPIIASRRTAPWELIGIGIGTVGFLLLAGGAVLAVHSTRKLAEQRKREREGSIDAAGIELQAASAEVDKLNYWLSVAQAYGDTLRAGQLETQMAAAAGEQRAAVRRLRSLGVAAEVPTVSGWRPDDAQ